MTNEADAANAAEKRKFYPAATDFPFLKIGFQLNFDLPLSDELEGWVRVLESLETNLVIWEREKPKPVVHVTAPARIYRPDSLWQGGETQIIFPGEQRALAQDISWLLLRRQNLEHFMACGRNGPNEKFAFGLSILRHLRTKKGWATENLQPLAYPGITGKFNPVYVKVALGGGYRYLLIEAEDLDESDVLVRVSEPSTALLPSHLIRIS